MIKIAAFALLLFSTAAAAQTAPAPEKVVISRELAEAIYQQLAKEPYASVAQLMAKLHDEVAPQLTPSSPPMATSKEK